MNTQPCGRDEAFARDLAELDRELEKRREPEIPAPTLDLVAGLIAVESNHWVQMLSAVRPTCARLDDGLRHRDIQIHVGSEQETKLLTRAEAGERGGPYRDLKQTS